MLNICGQPMTCYEIFYTWRMHRLKLTVYIHRAEVICHAFDFIIFLRESVRWSLFQICIQTSTCSTITFYILKTSEVDVFVILKEKFSFNRWLEILCGHRKTRQCGLFWEFDAKGEVLTSIADYPQINRFDSEVCLDFKLPLVRKLSRTPNGTLNLNKWSSFVNDFFFCATYARKIS